MSWVSGGDLAENLWLAVAREVQDPGALQRIAEVFYQEFSDKGCDTLQSAPGALGDLANRKAQEASGAPANPQPGTVWQDPDGEYWRYNNGRWWTSS